MKFLIPALFTMALGALLQSFFPWWTVAIGAFLVAFLFDRKGFPAFVVGFLSIAMLWLGYALIIDFSTQSILTEKLNRLLPINSLVLTALLGGLVGGFGALTGSLFRKI
jgi:MFS family permease